jgi:hypothetical protein
MYEWTKSKLGASDDARRAISTMVSEIRSAKMVRVGSGDATSFTPVAAGAAHIGRAIQIYPSTNTSVWVRYYWDASDQQIKRLNSSAAAPTIVASAVTNEMVFTAENYLGQPLTNNMQEFVVGLNLEFYQLQYPAASSGPAKLFDYYRLQTRVAQRAP